MRRCVFFDRDGIVNRSPGAGYVERWEDFHLLPEFVAVLAAVRKAGCDAVVVTNQRGVARGKMTREMVDEIHRRLLTLLKERHHLDLLDIFVCPHLEGACDCRKPQPGMLLQAARKHGIDLAASWMVGDQETDIEAGRRAGCHTLLVGGSAPTQADFRVPDLKALEAFLANVLNSPHP